MSVIDYFSRYIIMWAQPDLQVATLIEKFAENVMYRYGAIQHLISDSGRRAEAVDLRDWQGAEQWD